MGFQIPMILMEFNEVVLFGDGGVVDPGGCLPLGVVDPRGSLPVEVAETGADPKWVDWGVPHLGLV